MQRVYLYVDEDIVAELAEDIRGIADDLKTEIHCDVRANVALGSGFGTEISIVGEHILTVVAPLVAFYLGRGRVLHLRLESKSYTFRGYSAKDVGKLLQTLNSQAGQSDVGSAIVSPSDTVG